MNNIPLSMPSLNADARVFWGIHSYIGYFSVVIDVLLYLSYNTNSFEEGGSDHGLRASTF